jgi:hypothetical protein
MTASWCLGATCGWVSSPTATRIAKPAQRRAPRPGEFPPGLFLCPPPARHRAACPTSSRLPGAQAEHPARCPARDRSTRHRCPLPALPAPANAAHGAPPFPGMGFIPYINALRRAHPQQNATGAPARGPWLSGQKRRKSANLAAIRPAAARRPGGSGIRPCLSQTISDIFCIDTNNLYY